MLILSGDQIQAAKHCVHQALGIQQLSAVLFVAPDLDVVLRPLKDNTDGRSFSEKVMGGQVSVKWFKKVMGKQWHWRERNEYLENGERDNITQNEDMEKLIWGPSKHSS